MSIIYGPLTHIKPIFGLALLCPDFLRGASFITCCLRGSHFGVRLSLQGAKTFLPNPVFQIGLQVLHLKFERISQGGN